MANYTYSVQTNCPIGEYVRTTENNFLFGTTKMSKYVNFSAFEDLSKIYAYLNSKFTSGPKDSQDREKPFFDVVTASRNIWYRATDLDRRNIKLRSTKVSDDLGVFLATIHLQDWMKRENFGTFLNYMGINMAGFNESVQKFVQKDGRLSCEVVPWSQLIFDVINFKDNPKIQLLELSEAQLRMNKSYNQEMVDSLCNALTTRKTQDNQQQDIKPGYIKLYEVHGLFPKSHLTGEPDDEDEYVQQMHVISYLANDNEGEGADENAYSDYTLYKGTEKKDPYMLASLLPEIDGSIGFKGSVKNLFMVQWMQNHSVKAMKDQLDLASKMIFQTSDANFQGQNVLNAIENGDIVIHKPNQNLSLVNNDKSPNLSSITNFRESWKQLGMEIDGISESMLGINPPSGQAWRATNDLLQENHSLFQLMTENKSLAIEEMLREYIIPFLKTKMDTTEEIAATFNAHDIQKLDEKYIRYYSAAKSNEVIKEALLNGEDVTPEMQQELMGKFAKDAQKNLDAQGNQRYFKPSDIPTETWAEVIKDIEWTPEVDITNESIDREAMTTLSTALTVVTNPNYANNPQAQFIIGKILRLTGTISELELASIPPPAPTSPGGKVSESMSYKDVPEDVKRQMEVKAGLEPSQLQANPSGQGVPVGTPAGVQ